MVQGIVGEVGNRQAIVLATEQVHAGLLSLIRSATMRPQSVSLGCEGHPDAGQLYKLDKALCCGCTSATGGAELRPYHNVCQVVHTPKRRR